MQMTTLDRIYPRDRLSIADNPWHEQEAERAALPELLAYLIETKLNLNLSHRMVIEICHHKLRVTNVIVYSGTEKIGMLGVDRHQEKITLRNRAINEVMVRKGYMASGKANQLSANYDKFFRPATPLAKADRLRKKAYNEMARENMAQTRKSLAPTRAFVESLTDHIMQNFDKYKEIAINSGWASEHEDTLPSLYSDYTLVASIAPPPSYIRDSEGFYFYVSDGVCLATNLAGKKVGAHYANTLPEKLAAKVGMLKLANDKTFVRDVGYRQQQDFFYISGDYNEYT